MNDKRNPEQSSHPHHLLRNSAIAGVIVCIVLLGSYWVWGSVLFKQANKSSLPQGATGTLVLQEENSTVLKIYRSDSATPILAPGGQYISISPDGTELLVDGQQIVSTKTGKVTRTIRSFTPAAGMVESLWLSSQEVALGSYQSTGLYKSGLTSTTAPVLAMDCSFGITSPQAINRTAKTLLCLPDTDTASLGIIHYDNVYPNLSIITPPQPTAPQVAYISYPAWTPDGKHLIFVWGIGFGSNPPTTASIVMTNLDGTGFTTFASSPTDRVDDLPIWSPDGKQFAYVQEDEITNPAVPTFAVHLLTLATHHDQVIVSGTGRLSNLAWSPDGNYLAYDDITYPNSIVDAGPVTLYQIHTGHKVIIATGMTLVGWAQ